MKNYDLSMFDLFFLLVFSLSLSLFPTISLDFLYKFVRACFACDFLSLSFSNKYLCVCVWARERNTKKIHIKIWMEEEKQNKNKNKHQSNVV